MPRRPHRHTSGELNLTPTRALPLLLDVVLHKSRKR